MKELYEDAMVLALLNKRQDTRITIADLQRDLWSIERDMLHQLISGQMYCCLKVDWTLVTKLAKDNK